MVMFLFAFAAFVAGLPLSSFLQQGLASRGRLNCVLRPREAKPGEVAEGKMATPVNTIITHYFPYRG